jgi:hypothetical protein
MLRTKCIFRDKVAEADAAERCSREGICRFERLDTVILFAEAAMRAHEAVFDA